MKRFFLIIALFFAFSGVAQGEVLPSETHTLMRAEVVTASTPIKRNILGTDLTGEYQTVTARVVDGDETGVIVTIENDFIMLDEGEEFYLQHTVSSVDGIDRYDVVEPYRLRALGILIFIFLLTLFVFGGKQGLRGLLALCSSFAFIYFALLPGILHGYSPVFVSVLVSSVIIVCGSYITHGVNRTTSSAVIGMLIAVIITGLLAHYAILLTRLSGSSGHETFYLQMNMKGSIDLAGLLLGGMLIGFLGVLYDAAIGQAVAIEELFAVSTPKTPRGEIFRRALRIGREHIGALVNTLAIAYAGTALPLLLLYYSSIDGEFLMTINREVFATEIVRIIVGSTGLLLAVPITSLVATLMLSRGK